MGNRHGGEKPKEEKKKKRKEKKPKHKGKKKLAAGSDVDVDMESSHISHADSESMVFHSAENLSPYLDASTRSEEGATCAGFNDNSHILSSRDFHDGFSIEACLPADLAAVGRIDDVTGDSALQRTTDDVTSVASGGYSTPLLSSPQVRRGVPRSPLAQRPKDSFLEPVPPIPSDFSSNTLSSAASAHEDLTSSGERSSSRASSSTIDTNAAHCIERLEELERNIERTIIEKFSDGTSPLPKRRADRGEGEGSREGSVTPKRLSGGAVQGASDSPAAAGKAHEVSRPHNREGSATPKGVVRGLPSQSLENSPVILRKPVQKQESPSLVKKTPTASHGSPSLPRTALVKPESPVMRRKVLNIPDSPSAARRSPSESPRLQPKHVGSPRSGRRRAPESPLLRRKGVPLSEDSSSTDQEPPYIPKDGLRGRARQPGFQSNQTSQKSPNRSPEVRKKQGTKTPSSSPSPRSLGRKRITTEEKKPAVGSTSPVTQIKFCELNKGTPVKRCIVSTQPSTAVVLSSMSVSQESVDKQNGADNSVGTKSQVNQPFEVSGTPVTASKSPSGKPESSRTPAVSEETIKESSESAVFGSVSPKLKRQRRIVGADQSTSSLERQRTESLDSSSRSPPCSPPHQRYKTSTSPPVHSPSNVVSTHSVNVIEYKKSAAPAMCISTLKYPPTPETQRSPTGAKTVSKEGSQNGEDQNFIASDIAGRITFHSQLSVESVGGNGNREETTEAQKHMSPTQTQKIQGREPTDSSSSRSPVSAMAHAEYGATNEPVYSRIQKNHTEKVEPPVIAKRPVYNTTRSIDEGTTVSIQRGDADRAALIRSNTVPVPAGAGEFEAAGSQRGNTQQNRAFSPGSTVQWNASRNTEAAEGASCFQDASRFDENARACGSERGARAKLVPSSRSLSETGSSSTSGQISRNLGQRIRDVIHESSYREVFTAELSPTCLSDDPDHIPHIDDADWDNYPSPHDFRRRQFRGGYSGSSVDSYEDRYHSDSPYFPASPASKRAASRASAVKRAAGITRPPVSKDNKDTPLSNVVVQENVSYLPESITIRRIDVDANVTLPCQYQKGQTIITPAFPAVGASSASTCHSAKGYQPATGYLPGMMDSSVDPDDGHTSAPCSASKDSRKLAETPGTQQAQQQDKDGLGTQTKPHLLPGEKPVHKETVQAETTTGAEKQQKAKVQNVFPADRNITSGERGDKQTSVLESSTNPSPSLSHPQPHPHPPAASSVPSHAPRADVNTDRQQRMAEKEGEKDSSFPPEASSALAACKTTPECEPRTTSGKPSSGAKLSTPEHTADRDSKTASLTSQGDGNLGDGSVAAAVVTAAKQKEVAEQFDNNGITETYDNGSPKPVGDENGEGVLPEHVPPPSPTAMDLLMEEEEEEEDEEDEDMFNAHKDSDISFMISKEMQQFGETVVKRLSSLLESQASESDSCLEDGRDGRSRRDRNGARPGPLLSKEDLQDEDNIVFEPEQDNGDSVDTLTQSHRPGGKMPVGKPLVKRVDGVLRSSVDTSALQEQEEQNVHQQDTAGFLEDTQPKLKPSFPSAESFLTESDTTENFSETAEHETTASSNRASTASTATDETLTSFKTRSTTDSAEFDEAHFMLPESLVFVRSVDEEDDHRVDDAVIESGNIVRRPSIPKELTKSGGSSDERPQKLRKKRRRQPASSYDNVTRGDLNEPEPKRGSKQIRDVIDAYCDEESEDSSDLSSSNDGACGRDVIRKSDVSRVECEPVHRQEYLGQQVFVRKPKPPADRSSGSSEEGDVAARRRLSSSSVDSSLRIPEIEETFSELMNVKTFLDDLEDRTPTADSVPVFVASDDVRAKDWSASHLRRSRMSPAKTDRTESDLDISEQRDDASTDSMYADDEDEGNEVVFQRSYSEEHGGEVLLSCTIYNSAAHDDGADSDDFWAESSAAEENYKKLETAADEAGSAFQNARIQMHDIHQHLQDLRRQMELLQDDITSTSLTLTPDYSLESCEPRPVTE